MLNKVILIGKIGTEPEIKYFKNNSGITILKLVTTENINGKKNNNWHRIIINSINKYFKKNMFVYILGKIKTRRWLNSKNEYNYITEIFTDEIKIINNDYKKNNNDLNEENEEIKENKEDNLENEIFKNNEINNNEIENEDDEIYKNEEYKYIYSTSEESS
ncbi:single-stranded DNA-binding protein [Candidatus Nasuia deltocephalinicola]|uniref:single-stranded DNA-binding protein n=1 Tax=Candidatus Nasuia deltocephalincola TaxID=1160784 RepID=UPI00216B24C6|nr:single-stranded DNA-binding protein [Candidatus Nasuia deltocephalinicola]